MAREQVTLSRASESRRFKTGTELSKKLPMSRCAHRPDLITKAKFYPAHDKSTGKTTMTTKIYDQQEGENLFEEGERTTMEHKKECVFFPAENPLFTVPTDRKLFLAKRVESGPIADLKAVVAEVKQMVGTILVFNCLEKVSKAKKSEKKQLVKDAKKSISAKKCIPAEAVFALLKDNP
ncbi:unnamed protein product [Prorocentrum cordatum]|uniref:Uncharacterized protein n=1 Tax=Prorocentrum cordatum TaxID=2364126 RepID=A0ABN9S9T2_9DINO|nr:unnamed protein product [Polarella glacialis]